MRSRVIAWRNRLQEQFRYVDRAAGITAAVSLYGQLPQQFLERKPEGLLFLPWGSEITMMSGYRWIVLCAAICCLISSPSLHWRHLLAPRGSLRAQLGPRIVWTTLCRVVLLITVLHLALGLVVCLLADDSGALFQRLPDLAWRYLPLLLLDLGLLTAVAAALRGQAGSLGRTLETLVALAAVWLLIHLTVFLMTDQPKAVLGHRDFGYVGIVIVGTCAAVLIARRTWFAADLAALLRSSRQTPQSND